MWVRASTWITSDTITRRNIINHEIGHTFGLAEHYVDSYVNGSVNDTSVYFGVMDNDFYDSNGWPSINEILGAHWSTGQWY